MRSKIVSKIKNRVIWCLVKAMIVIIISMKLAVRDKSYNLKRKTYISRIVTGMKIA